MLKYVLSLNVLLTEIDLYMTYKGVKKISSMKTVQIPKQLQFECLRKFQVNYFVSRKEFILQKNNQLYRKIIGNVLTHQKSIFRKSDNSVSTVVTLIKIRHTGTS